MVDGPVLGVRPGVEGEDGPPPGPAAAPPSDDLAFVALEAVGLMSLEVEGEGEAAVSRLRAAVAGEAIVEGNAPLASVWAAVLDFANEEAVGVIALLLLETDFRRLLVLVEGDWVVAPTCVDDAGEEACFDGEAEAEAEARAGLGVILCPAEDVEAVDCDEASLACLPATVEVEGVDAGTL